jgi:hypothetical protein
VRELQCYVLLLDVQIIPGLKDNRAETKAWESEREREREREKQITEPPTIGSVKRSYA